MPAPNAYAAALRRARARRRRRALAGSVLLGSVLAVAGLPLTAVALGAAQHARQDACRAALVSELDRDPSVGIAGMADDQSACIPLDAGQRRAAERDALTDWIASA